MEAVASDYGYVILHSDAVQPEGHWFHLPNSPYPISSLATKDAYISGYPYSGPECGDQKMCLAHDGFCQMIDSETPILSYLTDTSAGQSGSPIWIDDNGKLVLVGIHTCTEDMNSGQRNKGVRLTSNVIQEIQKSIAYSQTMS